MTQSAAAGAVAGADLPARLAPVLQLVAVQPLLGTLAQLSCTTFWFSFGSSKEFLTLLFDTVTRSAHILSLRVSVVCADAAIEGVSAAPAAVTFAHRG